MNVVITDDEIFEVLRPAADITNSKFKFNIYGEIRCGLRRIAFITFKAAKRGSKCLECRREKYIGSGNPGVILIVLFGI
jgi:hypothetical protein